MSKLDEWFPRDRPPSGPAGPFVEEEKVAPTKKEYDPFWIKKKGEDWTKKYLKDIFGIKVWKRSDAPIVVGDKKFPGGREVDFYGSVPVENADWSAHLEMEVKAFAGDSFSLSNIKAHQAEALDNAYHRGDIAMLSLVQIDRPSRLPIKMWWIPWSPTAEPLPVPRDVRTFRMFMEDLRLRESGNFKAKSIRLQDLELLDEWLVQKENGIWKASANFWLARITGLWNRVSQQCLL